MFKNKPKRLNKNNSNVMKLNKTFSFVVSALLLVIFTSSPLAATENLEVTPIDKSKMIRMELSTPIEASINIMLINKADKVVYRDQISPGATFDEEFDFSTVRQGTYTLVSEMGNMRYNRILKVTGDAVNVTESFYSFVPQFKLMGDRLMIQYIKNPDENIAITIENEKELIYDDYYTDQENVVNITYDLGNLSEENYLVNFSSGKNFFTYEFKLIQE
jgi:hypothetical protein